MFRKKKTALVFCGLLMVGSLNAEQTDRGGSPFGELKNSRIFSGYEVSTGGNFFGASFKVSSSVAQAMVGTSASDSGEFVVNSGGVKPNRDLIFINGLDLIFLNVIHNGERNE